MIHDNHDNWTRLTSWDQAELRVPGISVEWDILCSKDPSLQMLKNAEIWMCIEAGMTFIDIIGHHPETSTGVFKRWFPWGASRAPLGWRDGP